MNLAQKLELRQGQTLLMTPQLVQAIKLLQMPHHELQAFIDAEVESNPLLEHSTGEDDSGLLPETADLITPEQDIPETGRHPEAEAGDDGWFLSGKQPHGADLEQTFDNTLENVFPDDNTYRGGEDGGIDREGYAVGHIGGFREGEELPEISQTFSARVTLHEHLQHQLDLATADIGQRLVGGHLIDAIDENGYLSVEPSEIAGRLGVDESEVLATLALIQGFEPTGVGARNLHECLMLQLRERNRFDPVMECFLSRLDLVARRDITGLRKHCGVDAEEIAEMIGEIRSLDPKPGSAFGAEPATILLPDVLIRRNPDGNWQIELNPETLPRILVNQDYYATLAGSENRREGEDRTFLTDCLARANWLARSLEQRARTILKVATEIVRQQEGFFLHGVRQLKPLTLRQIADAIEMHESTVSRVTANKSFGTDRGIFEMKFFFSAALPGGDGSESPAAEAVRQRIRELIDQEKPDGILSDDALVTKLKQENIEVARRTVAKYRESLKIPSSPERRRMKRPAI